MSRTNLLPIIPTSKRDTEGNVAANVARQVIVVGRAYLESPRQRLEAKLPKSSSSRHWPSEWCGIGPGVHFGVVGGKETDVGWGRLKRHKLLGRGSQGVHTFIDGLTATPEWPGTTISLGNLGVASGRQASWMEGDLI